MIGPFKPSSSHSHVFILTATHYFLKWVKFIPLREVTLKQVANFIRTHLVYKYVFLYKIILDNVLYFKYQAVIRLVEKYKFIHNFSSSYNSLVNGQVEAFNKVLCNILKKMVSRSRRDWHE